MSGSDREMAGSPPVEQGVGEPQGAVVPPLSDGIAPGKPPPSSNISVFLRLKPVSNPSNRVLVDMAANKAEFVVPREASAGCAHMCTFFASQPVH